MQPNSEDCRPLRFYSERILVNGQAVDACFDIPRSGPMQLMRSVLYAFQHCGVSDVVVIAEAIHGAKPGSAAIEVPGHYFGAITSRWRS